FRHANSVIEGTARLRASILGTTPHLLLVWDYGLAAELGSTADFMDCWSDPARLHVIDLNGLRGQLSPAALAAAPPAGSQCLVPPPVYPEMPPRRVHAMLFADVVGFSKLKDEHLPVFWDFMAQLRDDIDGCHQPLTLIESWGDALYVVMDTASAMAEYAFVLMEAIETIDTVAMGLPVQLRLRVGLHAGPVFNGLHPLTGRPIVYGGHVNRAARIEPVTLPGQIYASEQFVALLTAEESAAAAEARLMGDSYESGYVCEYLGILALAKQFGEQAVYHLRKALAYCPTPVVPDY
ncbi:MAG: adenylate/guanylate cyclase domain-containing protein, partial [Rhodospirillales bacterium]|nr:adenylate/guanylate cyclase domain-containing protein [Rhodospirillales bacterium]